MQIYYVDKMLHNWIGQYKLLVWITPLDLLANLGSIIPWIKAPFSDLFSKSFE